MGTWKRTIKKDKTINEFDYFTTANRVAQKLIETASVRYGGFLGRNAEVR
jgi:hypothetical protein